MLSVSRSFSVITAVTNTFETKVLIHLHHRYHQCSEKGLHQRTTTNFLLSTSHPARSHSDAVPLHVKLFKDVENSFLYLNFFFCFLLQF